MILSGIKDYKGYGSKGSSGAKISKGYSATCPSHRPFTGNYCSSEGIYCTYRRECYCGECSPSIVCDCDSGKWGCYKTDFCEYTCCDLKSKSKDHYHHLNIKDHSKSKDYSDRKYHGHIKSTMMMTNIIVQARVTPRDLNAMMTTTTMITTITAQARVVPRYRKDTILRLAQANMRVWTMITTITMVIAN